MHAALQGFSPVEVARYQRQLGLAGFGAAGQARLKGGAVLVIGAGGLGCPALLYLAAAGVGRIVIVDADVVDVSNLQRQVLYSECDVGELKVTAATRRLRALNPLISIEPHAERFISANALALVRDVDVAIDGSDNFATRYLVNDACVMADRPFIYGAIHAFAGQLSVFNWRDGPTYRCLYPEPPDAGTVPNCDEAGVLGFLPGLVGIGQACEAIKLLTGIGEPLSGRLLLWDALTMQTRTVAIPLDPRSRSISALPPDGYGETCATSPAAGNEIDVAELRRCLQSGVAGQWQLIDVRESWERELGAIEASLHLPLAQLEDATSAEAVGRLAPSRPTVVYCAAGARSIRAAIRLRTAHGFTAVRSLRGGFRAWQP